MKESDVYVIKLSTVKTIKIIGIILIAVILIWSWFHSQSDSSQLQTQQSSDSQIENTSQIEINDQFTNIKEQHYTHLPITYSIDIPSENYYFDTYYGKVAMVGRETKEQDIRTAFKLIENSTGGIVKFREVNPQEEADIHVIGLTPLEMGTFLSEYNASSDGTLGLGLHENITNKITNGTIYFQPIQYYENTALWTYSRCTLANKEVFPDTEIHEILHSLGFYHNPTYINSIMFPMKLTNKCNVKNIDSEIIQCLRYIYSNGSLIGDCALTNIPPYLKNYSLEEKKDLIWNSFPITYSIFNCESPEKYKLQNVIRDFETVFKKKNLFVYNENTISQINFYCNDTYYENLYESEIADYWENFQPAIKSYYVENMGYLSRSDIHLFYPSDCKRVSYASNFELVALYRAIGLRTEEGEDIKDFSCSYIPGFSSKTMSRLKEMYPSLST
ncbi:MAG: matrixin family metalloprotease [Nanoarchaeota archaeon]|nr:matrixin family metalloprotease [Nanoarchaeota archaeon]